VVVVKNAGCRLLAVLVLIPLMLSSKDFSAVASSPALGLPAELNSAAQQKVASGRLLQLLSQKYSRARAMSLPASQAFITVAIYASARPSQQFIDDLAWRGVQSYPDSWIPPLKNHPLGFFFAQVPLEKTAEVLALDRVVKMESAESQSAPMNNLAAREIKADVAWAEGWTGTGVVVGVLDSGLDLGYEGNELPAGITVRDYSNYPAPSDKTVSNTVTGHGTHVTGSILGRGTLSASNTVNGGGAYKGMAPNAKLVFLKIGLDGINGATDRAEIAAIHAAVDDYHVNLINLSYGGWDAFHDGSDIVSQAIDYAYDRGVACFVAAGNYASAARHAQGYVPASGMSDFIEVNVRAKTETALMRFNLVCSDGADRSNLSLLYYDAAKQPLDPSRISLWMTTESSRGTESQFSEYDPDPSVSASTGTYYVRVVNPSSRMQEFHIFDDIANASVSFAYPDPKTTITYPGDADHAFTVGAYSSRTSWTAWDGLVWPTGKTLGDICSYSGRGPRVDGMMKPDIAAPGSMIISLRDRNMMTSNTPYIIGNDGTADGPSNYCIDEGTSMATPVCTGAAALILQETPASSPQQLYDALRLNSRRDAFTGSAPNPTWGFGKLDVSAMVPETALPIELVSFSYSLTSEAIALHWGTATETHNCGFEIEKKEVILSASGVGASGAGTWSRIGFVAGNGTTAVPHEYSFVDNSDHAGTFQYRLKQIDRDGNFTYSAIIEAAVSSVPMDYALSQNFPNPFNPSTTIEFTVAAAERVRLGVYDLLGKEIAVLADRHMQPGKYSVEWNARAVPSGVYFYRLNAGRYWAVKKLMYQK
jgi:subtilisin family serine protease